MSTNTWIRRGTLLLGVLVFGGWPVISKAVTVEVEEDEDEIVSTPNPPAAAVPVKEKKDQKPAPKPAGNHALAPTATPSTRKPVASAPPPIPTPTAAPTPMPRVRISDNIGFYYLVESGFVAKEEDQVPSIGKVVGSFDDQSTFSTPHKTYIELTMADIQVKPGDLFVVSRVNQPMQEPHSDFSGYWVRNLGIAKVLEVDHQRCQVQVIQSFGPIEVGDKARLYGDEVARWKQAQTKKTLPDHPIQCYVAGGDPSHEHANQTEWVILTAGSRKGVVEGQRFQLRRRVESMDPALQNFQGEAQVFYAGEDYCLAQILFNHEPIGRGFEAVYQP